MGQEPESDREVERLLAFVGSEPTPSPSPDLVGRTLRAVRQMILAGDVLRFATLEALWKRLEQRRGDAHSDQERHNR